MKLFIEIFNMYYILHIPSGTYLYSTDKVNYRCILAKFDTKEQAEISLNISSKEWCEGNLYFEEELMGNNSLSVLRNLWGPHSIKEFEIVYRDT